MARLPSITHIDATAVGWGFFLCARKEVKASRTGEYIALVLQDASGQMVGRIFQDVERQRHEFDAGDFVKVHGRGDRFGGRVELLVEKIRRVNPDRDSSDGFREEECVPAAPRPIAEMWAELQQLLAAGVGSPFVRTLLQQIVARHERRLKSWPAAQIVHHAYRGGLLEHILKVAEVGRALAAAYEADSDLVVAGAVLHDIGKLEELDGDRLAHYSREGNLVGHVALGVVMVRQEAAAIPDFPVALRTQLEHLIVSHHGSRELGAPLEPMTVEAFILAAADELDAKIFQVRRHVADDEGEGEFTAYHPRLRRVLFKPPGRRRRSSDNS